MKTYRNNKRGYADGANTGVSNAVFLAGNRSIPVLTR
jgi:hypothetical protein